MLLVIGPAGRYLIFGLLLLVVLGGGITVAFVMSRRRSSGPVSGAGTKDKGSDRQPRT